jgi:hypothetical protein
MSMEGHNMGTTVGYETVEKQPFRITMEGDILKKQIELVYDLSLQLRERLSTVLHPGEPTTSENVPKMVDPMSAMANALKEYQNSVQAIRNVLEDSLERLEL